MILRLMEKLKTPNSVKIPDIGCSSGILISDLRERGFKDLHGMGISPVAIRLCKYRRINNATIIDVKKLVCQKII